MSDRDQQERDPNGLENYTANNSRKRRRRRQEIVDDPSTGEHYAQQASMPIFMRSGHRGHHGRHGIMPYDIGQSSQPASEPESPFANVGMLVVPPMFGPPQAPHETQPSDGAYYWVPLPGQDRYPMPASMGHPSSMRAELGNWMPYATQMHPGLGTIHSGHYAGPYQAQTCPRRHRVRRAKRRVQAKSPTDNMSREENIRSPSDNTAKEEDNGSPIDNMSREKNIGVMEGGANVVVKKLRNDFSVKTTLLHGIFGYKKRDSDNETHQEFIVCDQVGNRDTMSCPGPEWPFQKATYGAGVTVHIHVSYRPTRDDEISEEALDILSANVPEVHGVRRQNLLSPEMPEGNSGREEDAQSPMISREVLTSAKEL